MNKTEKGQKPSQQDALNALSESHQLMNGLSNAIGRLAQAHSGLEKGVEELSTHLGLLLHVLIDKKIVTEEDLDAAYKKYVVQPQEEGLTKHIELLKQQSAEDAFFAAVLEKVRAFTFADREINGENVKGAAIRGFYIKALLNPAMRHQVMVELRDLIPDLPQFTPPVESQVEEVAIHPDCHYCNLPDCTFCNPIQVDQPDGCDCVECDCAECPQATEPTVE